jgi:hypothetical protein
VSTTAAGGCERRHQPRSCAVASGGSTCLARHTGRGGADEGLAGTPRTVRDRRRRPPTPPWDRGARFAGGRRPADRVVVSPRLGVPAPGRSGARDTPDHVALRKGSRSRHIADSSRPGSGRPAPRGPSPCRPNGRAEWTDAGRDRRPWREWIEGPGRESATEAPGDVSGGQREVRGSVWSPRPGIFPRPRLVRRWRRQAGRTVPGEPLTRSERAAVRSPVSALRPASGRALAPG